MAEQRRRARAAWKGGDEAVAQEVYRSVLDVTGLTEFVGYDTDIAERQILAMVAEGETIDRVLGVEARGFLLAAPVAYRLGASLVPVRKPGKLPHDVESEGYQLEYGDDALEAHVDALGPGERCLVVDDVLAAIEDAFDDADTSPSAARVGRRRA